MASKYLLSCLSVMLLSACASIPPGAVLEREIAGVSSQPPMFVNGYRDGCQSGLSAGGNTTFQYAKNLQNANNPQYKLGWEDGFRICQSRQVQRNNQRNSYDGFNSPWFPRTGVTIGVQL